MNITQIAEKNRKNYPLDELRKYCGQHVAWSPDNTHVLLSSPDLGWLYDELDRRGIKDYILEYLPDGPSV